MRRTYDKIFPVFAQQCAQRDPPLDPIKVLPEPPGMAEYRQRLGKQIGQQELDKQKQRDLIKRK